MGTVPLAGIAYGPPRTIKSSEPKPAMKRRVKRAWGFFIQLAAELFNRLESE